MNFTSILLVMCRPAGTEALDQDMPAITIPGKAGWGDASDADSLYFITIQAATLRPLLRKMSRNNSGGFNSANGTPGKKCAR